MVRPLNSAQVRDLTEPVTLSREQLQVKDEFVFEMEEKGTEPGHHYDNDTGPSFCPYGLPEHRSCRDGQLS